MLTSKYKNLSEDMKLLYGQVATCNPFVEILVFEKKELESFLLNMSKIETETDSDFRRRYENHKIRLDIIRELLTINDLTLQLLSGKG